MSEYHQERRTVAASFLEVEVKFGGDGELELPISGGGRSTLKWEDDKWVWREESRRIVVIPRPIKGMLILTMEGFEGDKRLGAARYLLTPVD